MPTVTTIEGCAVGSSGRDHVEEAKERLDACQHELNAVADKPTCTEKFDALIRAQGLLEEAFAHAGSIESMIPEEEDVALSDRLQRTNEHLVKVRDAFRDRCVRK